MQRVEDVFLPYLQRWEDSVEARSGFTRSQKQRMLLSTETRIGLRITGMLFILGLFAMSQFIIVAKSFVGLLLSLFCLPEVQGEKLAFLSGVLSQDPLENFFGCQRQ